jgi:hypothetical protein
MPGAHRDTDSRFCDGKTEVSGQGTVYVNSLLWAVDGDQNNHVGGNLIPVYGAKNVYINGKLIIVAVGDIAAGDDEGHPAPPTDPQQSSGDVFAYG